VFGVIIKNYVLMKVKIIRIIIYIYTMVISLFSFFLILGLVIGFVRPLWLAIVVGGNVIILFTNAALLYILNIDKNWWNTKDQLDDQIETYKRKCVAYQRAREDLIQVQLKYHYDNASEEYNVTLKKLKD